MLDRTTSGCEGIATILRQVSGAEIDAVPYRKYKNISIVVTMLASLFSRASGLVTQVITAWYLSPDDFGVYAIALGICAFTLAMRGGGTGITYLTMTPAEFPLIGGGLFRMAMFFASLGALLTLGSALPAEQFYDEKALIWVLIWLAILSPLNHLALYPRGKMASNLLFKQIAWIDVVAAIIKVITAWVFARDGYGPLALVLCQVCSVGFQIAITSVAAKFTKADFQVSQGWIRSGATMLKYPLLICIAISILDQIDLFIASLFVPLAIPLASLGVYFLANQLAFRPLQLLTSTLSFVLAPYTARLRGNPKLEKQSILEAFTAGIIFIPLFILFVATVYPSLAQLAWGEKWVSSIWPVRLACILLIFPTVLAALEGPLMGMRRWKLYLAVLSWRAAAKIAGVLLAVLAIAVFQIPDEGIAVALVIGVGTLSSIVAYMQIRSVLARFGCDQGFIASELYLTPLYALLAFIGVDGIVRSIVPMLPPDMAPRIGLGIEFALSAVLYGLTAGALLRFAYLSKLRMILALLPAPTRTLACTIFFLREQDLVPPPDGTIEM